jgi:hypothetical protein
LNKRNAGLVLTASIRRWFGLFAFEEKSARRVRRQNQAEKAKPVCAFGHGAYRL